MLAYLFKMLLSYLLGSIPFGLLIGKAQGVDLREHGSKNIGATNAFRVLGKSPGILVFALDALKGFVAVKLASLSVFSTPAVFMPLTLGVVAILGHTFPVWLKFKGGKGVATSLGVFLGVCPVPAGLAFFCWLVVFLTFRIISIASIAAAFFFPIMILFTYRQKPDSWPLFIVSLLLLGFILFTHRSNIGRLRRGEEKKIF